MIGDISEDAVAPEHLCPLPIKKLCELLSMALMKPLLERRSESKSAKHSGTVRKAVEELHPKPSKKIKVVEQLFQTPLAKTGVAKLARRVDQHICPHIPVKAYGNDDGNADENKGEDVDAILKQGHQVTKKGAKGQRAERGVCRWHTLMTGSSCSIKSSLLCAGCTTQLNAKIFLCSGTCWQNWHQQDHSCD